MMLQPIMLTIKEAAKYAGVPVHALRVWIKDGDVYAVKSGSRYYVNLASLMRFLNGNTENDE